MGKVGLALTRRYLGNIGSNPPPFTRDDSRFIGFRKGVDGEKNPTDDGSSGNLELLSFIPVHIHQALSRPNPTASSLTRYTQRLVRFSCPKVYESRQGPGVRRRCP